MTSSPNLGLVRSIVAAWERGDYTSPDWAHPDIEWVIVDGPSPGTWAGAEALQGGGWRDFLTAWVDFRIELDRCRELDDERILVLVSGRGKSSGLDVGRIRSEGAGVFHVRDGKVARLVTYLSRERALADLGLAADAGDRE